MADFDISDVEPLGSAMRVLVIWRHTAEITAETMMEYGLQNIR
jgi:hypothetical protein